MKRMVLSLVAMSLLTIALFVAPVAAQTCNPSQQEQNIWDAIKQSSVPQDFLAYLNKFPRGCFRDIAIFKLEALIPATVPISVSIQVAGDGRWFAGHNGDVVSGGENIIESIRIAGEHLDPTKISFDYSCDAAGKGVTNASNDQACPTNGRAPIQGFGVTLAGSLKDFYDLSTSCTTLHKPDNSKAGHSSADGGWCGVRGGTPATYLCNVKVSVTRKKFQ